MPVLCLLQASHFRFSAASYARKSLTTLRAPQSQRAILSGACAQLVISRLIAVRRGSSLPQDVKEWPKSGGATGTIRFYPEIEHKANAGARN